MSLEAIKTVTRAEEDAAARKAETAASCKRLVADAETRGRALLDNALIQAAKQESGILTEASGEAEKKARAVLEKAEADARKLEQAAQAKAPDAVKFVVERIIAG